MLRKMRRAMSNLRAGFAKAVINPDPDTPLVGYDFRFKAFGNRNDGVLDDLYARVIALQQDDADGRKFELIWVTLDLCVLDSALALQIRREIADLRGIELEHVHLCCSHTHSGPYPELAAKAADQPRTPQLEAAEPLAANVRYGEQLRATMAKIVQQAAALTEPVTLRHAEISVEFGYKRRVISNGQLRICWNIHEWTDLPPAKQPDPTVSALVMQQASGRQLVLWSAGVHPVCLGKTSNRISADWPGFANAYLQRNLPNCEPLYCQGAAGEVHPLLATQDRAEALACVGTAVAAPLHLALTTARPVTPVQPLRLRTLPMPGCANMPAASVINLSGIIIIFLPLELFASLGERIRQTIAAPVFFATVSDGWEGYWPDRSAFAEGGYEVAAAQQRGRSPDDGETLTDNLIAAAQQLLDISTSS